MPSSERDPRASLSLGEFIRTHRDRILREWELLVRQLPVADALDHPALIDHIPEVLERVAEMADALATGTILQLPRELAEIHAVERLAEGFDLSQVVTEFAILRDCITNLWEESIAGSSELVEFRAVNQAIDKAVSASVMRFTRARDRTLLSLDRIASEALESKNLDELLHRLLKVFVQTTAAVDTAKVYIRENSVLRLRAALGDARAEIGSAIELEENFVGRVAATGRAVAGLATGEESTDQGMRALYAVPLVDGGEPIGVAYMGSRTAYEFSTQDKRLLGAMATRAATAIFQQVLRENAERSASELAEVAKDQRFLARAGNVLASSLDVTETLGHLAALAVPELADWCVIDVLDEGELQRVSIAHSNPEKAEKAREWSRRFPPELTRPSVIATVLRTGKQLFMSEVTDDMLLDEGRGAEYQQLLRDLGIRSCVVTPLCVRGRTLGTITLIRAESAGYSPADLETASELGRRAGLALDNAQLYASAIEAVKAREEMLAIVSHDLRNPIATIALAASVALEAKASGPEIARHLDLIQRAASRMEVLVTDLLDAGRLQLGRFSLDMASEEAASLITEVIDAHEDQAARRGIALHRDCQLDGAYVCCDRGRMMQAFGNLMANSLKFCRAGDQVIIRGRIGTDQVEVSIEDTGPGIAMHDLPRIFEPYWSSREHSGKGAGLGLYICKGIIEAHDGTITVDSKNAAGTRFSVTLPRILRAGLGE